MMSTALSAERLFAGVLAITGCAAPLDNPEVFADRAPPSNVQQGGPGGGGGGSAGGAAALAGGDAGGVPAAAGTAGVAGVAGVTNVAGATTSNRGGPGGDLPACVAALFASTASGKCSNGICHHAGADPSGGLDLASPGVTARLVNQPASHLGASPNSGCEKGDELIDSQQPERSWLLRKLTLMDSAACGAKMPLTGSLSADELDCIKTWVESF